MGYSYRGHDLPIWNHTDPSTHERVTVSVYLIDGTLVEEVERVVFLNSARERVVRYAKGEHKLRKKHGKDDCIVLPVQSSPKKG